MDMSRPQTQARKPRPSAKAAAAEASRAALLDAAIHVIRAKGYSAARVEDICAEAGLTKGAFFHHFDSKEACAIAAAAHFGRRAEALFAAPFALLADPRGRVFGYLHLRRSILQGELPEFTCLLGTMVQEAYDTHPAIRAACDQQISDHAGRFAADIAEAKVRYAPNADWNPESAALFSQAVLQGGFILAKAKHGPAAAIDCVDHLISYFKCLLDPAGRAANRGDET